MRIRSPSGVRRGYAVVLLAVLLGVRGGFAASPGTFTFSRLAGTHRDIPVNPAPASWGPFRVQLRVHESEVTLHDHRLRLTPLGGGVHRAEVEATFSGTGSLVAEVDALGFATEQEDRVELPLQTRIHRGRIHVARDDRGYRVTPLELPAEATVSIQSRLGGRLVTWCEGIPLLGAAGGGCGRLDRLLSQVTVPLPAPGETYHVPFDHLTDEERTRLDRYLDAAGGE